MKNECSKDKIKDLPIKEEQRDMNIIVPENVVSHKKNSVAVLNSIFYTSLISKICPKMDVISFEL